MKASNGNRDNHLFEFGPFRLDPAERLLLRDGEPVTIPPKAFDTLLALVENRGHAVRKDDLIKAVWPDTFVEENNLTQYVSLLRKALGENGDGSRYIETVPRWGYRFVGEVREADVEVTVHRRTRASVEIREEERDEPTPRPRSVRRWTAAALVVGALVVAGVAAALAFTWGASRSESVAALPEVRSIAVLPFSSVGANAGENDYLELGMADAVIGRLGRLERISVRSTSAVRAYAGVAYDPVEAGRALKVDAILEGRIQKVGERMRVTVQLVSASDGSSLWTEKFDESSGDVFAVQDAIAARVARTLAPVLGGQELLPAKRPTDNAKAYDAYLRGRHLWSKRTTENVRASIDHFKQAIAEDPNFALAYAGLADAYSIEAAPLAEPAIRRALELDDTIGEAHASLGFYRMFFHWDIPMAESELKLAIELSPNYATAHQWYALLLAVRGRLDEAKAEMATAIECDPLSPNMRADMAQICYYAGDDEAALAHCRAALELDPSFLFAHQYMYLVTARRGTRDEAVEAYIRACEAANGSPSSIAQLRATYAESGWEGFCRARMAQAGASRTLVASLYVQLGDTEQAIAELQKAYEQRDFFLIFVGVDPDFAPLRTDPRFVEILRGIGVV